MELVEVRRLTGPNLLLDGPAVVVDLTCDDPTTVLAALRARVDAYRTALAARSEDWRGWPATAEAHRVWDGGVGLTYAWEAPIDRLYAGCAVMEAAWDEVVRAVPADAPADEARLEAVLAETAEERDQRMLDLVEAAAAHGVAGVWDDDEISVGLGAGSRTWPRDAVPAPDEVPWDEVRDVPVALVTGTNGKSTTVRMLAGILRADGRRPGNSSTDGIVVDGELVEPGDWSGPGGGRTVGRDTRVGTMVLECARGGLLRRGLPLPAAQVAVVTNVAADHLGEYGIETVEDLADAKLVLAKAVRDDGVLVTNAEDPLIAARAPRGPRTWWFSVDPAVPLLGEAVAQGATVLSVVDGVLVARSGAGDVPITSLAAVPSALGGAAAHNVRNALAAAGAAIALGVDPTTIGAALRGFVSDAATNPGRANIYDVDGVTVVMDFAHNVHGVSAMASMAAALPATRRLVLFSQAGDRDDEALDGLAGAVAATAPDVVITAEVPGYLRGRAPMEVPTKLRDGLVRRGMDPAHVHVVEDARVGAQQALAWAEPGDVLLLLVLEARSQVRDLLLEHGGVPR